MPPKLRVEFPGAIYHVLSRGERREQIFQDDVDRPLGEHGSGADDAAGRKVFERRMEARRRQEMEDAQETMKLNRQCYGLTRNTKHDPKQALSLAGSLAWFDPTAQLAGSSLP